MSEATFTYGLTGALRKRLPNAVVRKLADKFTAGLPDFFISHLGVTTWFEVKLTTNKEIFRPIQLHTLIKLVRGAYIIWNDEEKIGQCFWVHDRDKDHYFYTFQQLLDRIVAMDTEEL